MGTQTNVNQPDLVLPAPPSESMKLVHPHLADNDTVSFRFLCFQATRLILDNRIKNHNYTFFYLTNIGCKYVCVHLYMHISILLIVFPYSPFYFWKVSNNVPSFIPEFKNLRLLFFLVSLAKGLSFFNS